MRVSEHTSPRPSDPELGRRAVVRLTDPGEGRVHHARPARPDRARRASASFRDETLADLKLALTEACSNSVRHAYGDGAGIVEIDYELQPRPARRSRSATTATASTPSEARVDEGDELTEGGLGIAIIRSLADEFELGGARPAAARASASSSSLVVSPP